MPYKFNETRRQKIPKARYRVANGPEYDAASAAGEHHRLADRRSR